VRDLSDALDAALAATAAAREILLAECARPGGPRGEIGHCPADDDAEWAIRGHLFAAFPTWGYLGEETGSHFPAGDADYVWIVDPNDGTTTMQRGYRGHAISIGLVHEGRPVLGVVCAVDAPTDRGDLWAWAEGCGPLRRNGEPIAPPDWPRTLAADQVVALSQGAHRNPVGHGACVTPARFVGLPSIAYRLAVVASGEAVATVSLNWLSAWDYAGGHALLRGVGAVLVDETGTEVTYARNGESGAKRVFGGAPGIVEELLPRPWEQSANSGFGPAAPPLSLAPVRARVNSLEHDPGVLERAQGALLGQLAGDALGALVEFDSAQSIAARYPGGGPRELAAGGPHHILAGQPTDDSEMALRLARSLVALGLFDAEAVAGQYAAWFHGWNHTEEPRGCDHPWCGPFDVGGTTGQALRAISATDVDEGHAASRARAAASRRSQANGALMRVSPLGIWGTHRAPADVAAAARADAALTHPHQVCQDASALFAVTLAAAIREGGSGRNVWAAASAFAHAQNLDPAVCQAVDDAAAGPPAEYLTQQGWVLIALRNAFYQLLSAPTLEAGVIATVRAGGDTDTNAAICGALLGAVHGRPAVPRQWQWAVLSCRPMPGWPGVHQPRPAVYWPIDALVLAERLVVG
jgi:ADP-ribosylglycohydrolase/fructose-1,6-bisphosphatase/inositol monophosphatase family enzyme